MKKMLRFSVLVLIMGFILGLTGCDPNKDDDEDNGHVPEWAKGFHNYPTGRVDPNAGRLTINNTLASEVLLFYEKVEGDKYIGTIGSLSSVRVKMNEQKLYNIIAIRKDNYIERRAQAQQFHEMTYYSNTQTYTISVSPSSSWGGGNWRFNNYTNFWVEVKKSDLTQNYAVIAPNAKSVNIPIEIGEIYDYDLYYSKDLKLDGIIIAKVETTNPKLADSVQVNAQNPTHVTDIQNVDITANTKPYVMVINTCSVAVRVFYATTQKTNGAPQGDIIVPGGQRLLFSGFEPGDLTTSLNFRAASWSTNHRYVPEMTPGTWDGKTMANDKVYEVTIPTGAEPAASAITVTEVNANKYLQ
jgi:hypothetical protein